MIFCQRWTWRSRRREKWKERRKPTLSVRKLALTKRLLSDTWSSTLLLLALWGALSFTPPRDPTIHPPVAPRCYIRLGRVIHEHLIIHPLQCTSSLLSVHTGYIAEQDERCRSEFKRSTTSSGGKTNQNQSKCTTVSSGGKTNDCWKKNTLIQTYFSSPYQILSSEDCKSQHKKVNQPLECQIIRVKKKIHLDRQRFSRSIPSAMLHIKQPSLGETCHKCHCNGAVPASLEVKTPSLKRWKPLKWTMKNGKISLKLKWPFKREKRPLKLKWPFKQEKRPLKVKRHTSYEE